MTSQAFAGTGATEEEARKDAESVLNKWLVILHREYGRKNIAVTGRRWRMLSLKPGDVRCQLLANVEITKR